MGRLLSGLCLVQSSARRLFPGCQNHSQNLCFHKPAWGGENAIFISHSHNLGRTFQPSPVLVIFFFLQKQILITNQILDTFVFFILFRFLVLNEIDAKRQSCRFWQALEHTGIRRSDPRLQDIVISMNEINRDAMASDDLELNEREFKRYLTICYQIAEKS